VKDDYPTKSSRLVSRFDITFAIPESSQVRRPADLVCANCVNAPQKRGPCIMTGIPDPQLVYCACQPCLEQDAIFDGIILP
jgi:hypothetical protein